MAFSPDGTTIASGSANYEYAIRLWDVASGLETASFDGHERTVQSLAFSPDGTTLVSGSGDRTVRLWDMATGVNTAILEGHRDWILTVAYSHDGATLASGSWDGTVRLWDAATGANTFTLEGHTNHVFSVAFSPDRKTLASGSWDGTVKLWDMAAGTISATLEGHTGWVQPVAFSPDGSILASGGGEPDWTIRLWDVASKNTTAVMEGHEHHVSSVAFSRTALSSLPGRWMAPSAYGTRPGQPIPLPPGTGPRSTRWPFPDGSILASGAADGTVLLWDLQLVVPGPRTLSGISGDEQKGVAGARLAEPFVVSVLDQNGDPFAGTTVTFTVTAGGGTLSATTVTTDADGRAAAVLTLGNAPGANTVTAAAAGLEPVTFTAAAEVSTDFDGDTVTGLSDFFLFADAFGGSDPRFDLDGDGSVGFRDFFLLADHFADPERGKLLALAREMIGLPDGPQLQQNAPNPFNSGTVISWFLVRPGPARVEVFSLTGQRVAVLREGPEKAGVHRVRWEGRDDRGRPLASGVYLYRLATEEKVQTRKLTLLR